MATFLPDEIIKINDHGEKKISTFMGVALLADISGFTTLCEKYSNGGKGGTYQLTATLNRYLGAMVEVIYLQGGDVLKFSGHSFLAIWKVKRDEFMYSAIHNVLTSALYIQQTMGVYETDVKVCLKVKLAISAGNMTFAVIGDDTRYHYVISGAPIEDVKAAECVCKCGDVVLTPSAWGHCSANNYEYVIKDSRYVKVTRIIYNPGFAKRHVVQQFKHVSEILDKYSADKYKQSDKEMSATIHTKERKSSEDTLFSVRPCVKEACTKKLGALLRPFMIPSVVQQVDADQPLEFLTEMRQITTLFVNLVTEKMNINTFIQTIDHTYTAICRIVQNAMGCVNKVCLFDKDVIFLIIFGLHGCKHKLEGQSGLQCAYSVWKAVKLVQGVTTVSVGVTTGMVYCGVVGHFLRRDYTIIGTPVFKAARIVCAYPGKVTCDQSTFLHAKLSNIYFILQDAIDMKGIDNVGPIYEYTEEKWEKSTEKQGAEALPLLGRNEPIRLFRSFLKGIKQSASDYNGFVIHGEARIGKSRLLEEMVGEAKEEGLHCILLMADSVNESIPYSTIHHMFITILNLSATATAHDKEERIVTLLGDDISSDELCYLNDVLQVKFPHSTQYLTENPENRKSVMQRIIRDLINANYDKLLIAVDDAQNVDHNSWELLMEFIDKGISSLLLTMYSGKQARHQRNFHMLLGRDKIVIFQLLGLEKAYITALACQILNVKAISSELDRILKNSSGGNPGWCESFLMTLMQSGCIKTEVFTDKEVKERSLVCPDTKLREKNSCFQRESPVYGKYIDEETDTIALLQEEPSKLCTIEACVVTSNWNINKRAVPENLEAVILSTFDCLSPYEQLLLKCASVLGNTLTRAMLVAVMQNPTPKLTALAVKRLFEMHIFSCGSQEYRKVHHQSNNPSQEGNSHHRSILCHCVVKCDVTMDDGQELPNFAFCKLLHFKVPLFREIVYDLLSQDQKKKFHTLAVNHLESQTHKCAVCGGGEFVYLPLALKIAEDVHSVRGEKYMEIQVNGSALASRQSTLQVNHPYRNQIFSRSSINDLENTEKRTHKKDDEDLVLETPYVRSLIKCLSRPEKEVHDLKDDSYTSITCLHPIINFHNCECPVILSGVYHQLVKHCALADLKEKQITFLIESGAIAVTLGNNTQALILLNEAMELNIQISGKVPLSTQQVHLGKIHVLLGQANLDMGDLVKAKKHLIVGIKFLGRHIYTFPILKHVSLWCQLSRQWLHQGLPQIFIGYSRGRKAFLEIQSAAALSHLSNLYMIKQDWMMSKLAALKSLNLVQKSNCNLYELCAAYSNMMDICHHYGKLQYSKNLEMIALHSCKNLYKGQEAKELIGIGRLYCATFSSRLLRGELESAIEIGFQALHISGHVFADNVKAFVLPVLIQALMMNTRLNEAADLLQELAFDAEEDLDKTSSTWYYALCMDIILDTCFSVEDPNSCCQYADDLLKNRTHNTGLVVRDTDSLRRLTISMWVWFTRKNQLNEAKKWKGIAKREYNNIRQDDSFSNLISSLKYLECVLIDISSCLNTSRPKDVSELQGEAIHIIKKLEKISKNIKIILPRFLHLKAYYVCMCESQKKGMELLHKAEEISKQHGNHLETAWMKHNHMVWMSTINALDLNFWQEHTNAGNSLDWHEFTLRNVNQITYSLCLPRVTL